GDAGRRLRGARGVAARARAALHLHALRLSVAPASALGLARERALELVEVVVVVPGDEADEVLHGHAAAGGVDAAAVQVLRAEAVEELHGLVAADAKGLQGLTGVV